MTNLDHCIADAIRNSAREVFTTMLGVEIGGGDSSVEASTPEANDGVVALIGIAGPWTGTGSLSCSPQLACRICAHMLMTESSSVNEEVLDAVAELTNMIVGGAKTALEAEVGPLGLSIPTVVYGRNFRTKSAIHSEWVIVRFSWEGEILEVRLCLARNEKGGTLGAHMPAPACALDV